MHTEIRVALRDWDWLTPWELGEVDDSPLTDMGYTLSIDRVPALRDLEESGAHAGAETSLSKYLRAVARGDRSVVALPHVLMQGFRHRCIIVSTESGITDPRQLVGGRIGVTGWPDSGNVWTRAALCDAGLRIEDAYWYAGRLPPQHPEYDRLDGYRVPGRIEPIFGRAMTERLIDGELDAVLTPFMPAGFYSQHSQFRPLYQDIRGVELAWAQSRGYVPGHHVLAFRAEVPLSARLAISRLLEKSKRQWTEKRHKYAETTAWTAVDFWDEGQGLPAGWDRPGLAHQAPMFEDFVRESVSQGLLDRTIPLDELFPVDIPSARFDRSVAL